MSVSDPGQRDALLRLGGATAEALANVLESLSPGNVTRGSVTVCDEGEDPLASLSRGSVTASVSYVNGATGANILVLTPAGARVLATAMGVSAPDGGGDPGALTELELSAVAEASNQMMSAASAALGVVLGLEIQISPPETRVIDNPANVAEIFGTAAHAMFSTFTLSGESCRMIQLVPSAFVMRMVRALDQLGGDPGRSAPESPVDEDPGSSVGLVQALGGIDLRVWAELGRTELPLGDALALPLGAVVELDRAADAPVDLFVNGVCFAHGHLIVTDDGEWAFALDDVAGRGAPAVSPSLPPVPIPEGATS